MDSKLPIGSGLFSGTSSSTKDPYEFGTGSPNIAAKSAKSNSNTGSKSHKSPGSHKSQHKAKEEGSGAGGINYSVLYESGSYTDITDGAGQQHQGPDVFTTGQPTITTAAGLSSHRSSSSGSTAVPASKRKRSGSSPRPAVPVSANNNANCSVGGFALNSANNALSIAIPTGNLNLNLSSSTLNSLHATIAGNKLSHLNKNNLMKDHVNIVVTGGTSTVLNGQLLTSIPTPHLTTDSSSTHIQLKNSSHNALQTNNNASLSQKSKSRKRTSSRSGSHDAAVTSGSAAASSGGAVLVDTAAMVTSSGLGAVTSPSPAMTPSPLFPTVSKTCMLFVISSRPLGRTMHNTKVLMETIASINCCKF